MSRYKKFIASIAATLGIVAASAADGEFSAVELEAIGVSAVGAFFVWALRNKPADPPV